MCQCYFDSYCESFIPKTKQMCDSHIGILANQNVICIISTKSLGNQPIKCSKCNKNKLIHYDIV